MTMGYAVTLFRIRAGYSLLEVIVVVAILGVAATLSGPSLSRMIAAQQTKQVVRGLTTELGALRAEAFMRNTPLTSQTLQSRLGQTLPEEWSVLVDDSVEMSANGYCTPGRIELHNAAGRMWGFDVGEGTCQLSSVTGS